MLKQRSALGFTGMSGRCRTRERRRKLTEIKDIRKNWMQILGISECRWTGSGQVYTSKGESTLSPGRNYELHQGGATSFLKHDVLSIMGDNSGHKREIWQQG